MITPELVSYIRTLVEKGTPIDVINENLVSAGWNPSDIVEALALTNNNTPPANISVPPTVLVSQKKFNSKSILAIAIVLVVIIGAGVTYAYIKKVGPFSGGNVYTEQNLFSGLLAKSASINTSAYSLSGSLTVGPRDKDANPFTIKPLNQDKLLNQYKNDSQRTKDAESILRALKYSTQNGYPSTLQTLKTANKNSYYNFSITDPATSKDYTYSVSSDGKTFNFQITFETKDAISKIRQGYGFTETGTPIDGERVTFTKDSPNYFRLSDKPPKPLLAELADQAQYLPNEFKIDVTASAKTDWQVGASANWTANLAANGDFGDLQYKFNIDALKKDSDYYFRINNIPSLFLMMFSNAKGVWVKISPKSENSNLTDAYGYNPVSSIADGFRNAEKNYQAERAELSELLRKAALLAGEENLFSFKNKPASVKVDNRILHRYDLSVNKDALLPFYQKLSIEAQKSKTLRETLADNGLIDYLQSENFNEIFNYYNENTTFTLWTDKEGFPAIVEYKLRLVPPDDAEQLKDKQANLVFTLKISDINKPVIVEAPTGAKTLEDLMGNSFKTARNKGVNAAIKANLSNLRASAELYYDSSGNYGKVSSSGNCMAPGTLFADKNITAIFASITKALEGTGKSTMTCYGKPSAWAASASLIDTDNEKGYWCVDSTGSSRLVDKAASTTVCPK